jgi:hypothetical protein
MVASLGCGQGEGAYLRSLVPPWPEEVEEVPKNLIPDLSLILIVGVEHCVQRDAHENDKGGDDDRREDKDPSDFGTDRFQQPDG